MIIENIWHLILSLVPALFNIGIAFYVFFYLPKNKTTTVFTYFVIALSLWQIMDVLFRTVTTIEQANFIDHFLGIGWISVAPLAFHFACRYASISLINNRYFKIAIYLPFVIMLLVYVSDFNVKFTYNKQWGWVTTPGTGKIDAILRILTSVMMGAVITVILRHAYNMRNDKDRKVQAFLIAIGILVPTLAGVVTQVAFPLFLGIDEIPITSTLMTFFSVAAVVSLSKFRLFDISELVAVESVLENLKNIVVVLSPEKKVLYMNPYTRNLFKLDEKFRPELPLEKMFSSVSSCNDFINNVFEPALQGHATKNYTTAFHTYDKKKIDVMVYAEYIINNNNIQGVLIVGNDITEHVAMLEELKVSNERYDLVSKVTNDMVWDWNLKTGAVFRNKEGWRKIFKDVLETEVGSEEEWNARIHPEDRWMGMELKKKLETATIGSSFELEFRVVKKDGGYVYLLDRGYIIKDEHGIPVRVIGAAQDITLRKETELKLKEEQLLKHKEITDAVILAQENERRLIGIELHDNINQILTSAMLYLDMGRTEIQNRVPFFDQSAKMISNAMSEVRKLSHSLIPPSWSGETLIEALHHLLEASEKAGLFVVQKEMDNFCEEEVPFKMKLNIYRIVQEQLNNIIKYARASSVEVKLSQEQGTILLSVQDDGVGFDPNRQSKGLGLTNIETRAYIHDGRVEIVAAPGKGCQLHVAFPVPEPELIS